MVQFNLEKLTLNEIKDIAAGQNCSVDNNFINELCNDKRKTVNRFGRNLLNRIEKQKRELERLKLMQKYEKMYSGKIIGGCDEAGRGPLCGPVVASIVILPENIMIKDINDSKKLSPKKRDELFEIINEKAVDIGVGIIDNFIVDEINILNATYSAVIKAFESLSTKPEILLTDALNINKLKVEQISLIKGDTKSMSIAAASIIAKVTRDRIMDVYHKKYPQYNFIKNKGYGTKEHIDNLKKYGPIEIHRKSFIKNIIN